LDVVRSVWNAVPGAVGLPAVGLGDDALLGPEEVDAPTEHGLLREGARQSVAVAELQQAVLEVGLGEDQVADQGFQRPCRAPGEQFLGRLKVEPALKLHLSQRSGELVGVEFVREVEERPWGW
jgi:hypothetical protein